MSSILLNDNAEIVAITSHFWCFLSHMNTPPPKKSFEAFLLFFSPFILTDCKICAGRGFVVLVKRISKRSYYSGDEARSLTSGPHWMWNVCLSRSLTQIITHPPPPKKKGGKKKVLPSGGNCNPLIFWTLDGGLAVIFIKETHSKLFWHDHVRFKAARNAQLKGGRGQIKTETEKIWKEEKDKLHRYGFVIILITVKDSGVWVNDGPRFS